MGFPETRYRSKSFVWTLRSVHPAVQQAITAHETHVFYFLLNRLKSRMRRDALSVDTTSTIKRQNGFRISKNSEACS